MKPRLLKIHHFEVDQDIESRLSDSRITDPKQSTSQQCSLPMRQNWMQLREVQLVEHVIVGRLCKIRVVEKPKIGPAFSPDENDLTDEVIESCYFLYHSRNNRLLMQRNNAVSVNPTAQMSNLLVHLFPDLEDSGLSIQPIVRDDVLKTLITNRGIINRVKICTTKLQRDQLHSDLGSDVGFREPFLLDTPYKEATVEYKIEVGGLKESIINRFFDLFETHKIEDAACYLENSRYPIWLSEYLKYDTIYADLNKSGHLVSRDVFDQLKSIDVD